MCDTILDAIGNTPLVRVHRITRGCIDADVLMKLETFNPGNSIKDRMAVRMIEDAEKAGKLKPGGTIIEGTSGNTGMGLAIAAVIKGYRCVFTTTDKQSKEKADALRAFGAEVIVCPTNVEPEDPRSYYSVSSRLEKEVPNSWKANQYDNPSNSAAHYEQTGPEIWDQTEGRITHLVVGVGTGGTISGAGKYLKEKNPKIKVWGIDTYGSVLKKYKETGVPARDLVTSGMSGELFAIEGNQRVDSAVRLMGEHDFSQISIMHDGRLVGSLNETHLYNELVSDPGIKSEPVESIMQPAFPFVDISTPVSLLATMITPATPAVLVRDFKTDKTFIITRSDILRAL